MTTETDPTTGTSGQDGKPERKPRPVYLDDPRMDRMVRAIVELTAQLYVAKDRIKALEYLLVDKGVLNASELDQYRGNQDLEEALNSEREALIAAVITRNLFED